MTEQHPVRRAHFWMGKVTMYRVIPIMILGYLTWNPFGISWWDWCMYTITSIPDLLSSWSRVKQDAPYGFLVVTIIMLGVWIYILREAWYGLGSRLWHVAIAVALFVVIYGWLYSRDLAPEGMVLKMFVGTIVYVAIGFCFCFPMINRWLSGVSTVVSFEGEEHR